MLVFISCFDFETHTIKNMFPLLVKHNWKPNYKLRIISLSHPSLASSMEQPRLSCMPPGCHLRSQRPGHSMWLSIRELSKASLQGGNGPGGLTWWRTAFCLCGPLQWRLSCQPTWSHHETQKLKITGHFGTPWLHSHLPEKTWVGQLQNIEGIEIPVTFCC